MSPLRTPRTLSEPPHVDSGEAVMRFELLEKVDAAVARAERDVDEALAALREHDARGGPPEDRGPLLDAAAEAVWRLIVQHEACDCVDHHELIEKHAIPGEVMARIGVKTAQRAKPKPPEPKPEPAEPPHRGGASFAP
jgi:hypothetical protein